jgi:hypothetical protein
VKLQKVSRKGLMPPITIHIVVCQEYLILQLRLLLKCLEVLLKILQLKYSQTFLVDLISFERLPELLDLFVDTLMLAYPKLLLISLKILQDQFIDHHNVK